MQRCLSELLLWCVLQLQQNSTAKGKENAKKAPRRKAAQNETDTVKGGSKSCKAAVAKEQQAPAPQTADEVG